MDAPYLLKQFKAIDGELRLLGYEPAGFSISELLTNPEDGLRYILHILPRCRGMVVRGNLPGAIAKLGFIRGVLQVAAVVIYTNAPVQDDEGYQKGFERGEAWAEGQLTIKQLRQMKRQS